MTRTSYLTAGQAETLAIYGPHLFNRKLTPEALRVISAVDPVLVRFELIQLLALCLEYPVVDGVQLRPGDLGARIEDLAMDLGIKVESARRKYDRIRSRWVRFGLVGILKQWLSPIPEETKESWGFKELLDKVPNL